VEGFFGRRSALYTVAVIMLVIWLLGLSSSYTFGGLLHVFLFVAVAAALTRYYRDIHPSH